MQLLQSGLLIATFLWALRERKRYRLGDKFRSLVVDFTADVLDNLYSETRVRIAELDSSKTRSASRTRRTLAKLKTDALSDFSVRLFHARTVILFRVSCVQKADIPALEELFERMEDEFTLAVARLTTFDDHPQTVTATIAKSSSEIMQVLLDREAKLSGLRSKR